MLLGVVALAPGAAFAVVALRRIGYPYELSYFEGSTVEVTARVVHGLPLYGPPTTDFTPWPYPPMYFWLTGALAQVAGVSITSLRLVSFVASLIVLVLIALVVRRAGGSLLAGVVAAGLYAASYRVSGAWADTARVDSLLLAFLLGAILLGLRARTWRGGMAVGGLLFLAFLTKQNALLVAAPMLLWLLVGRRPVGLSAAGTLVCSVTVSTVVGDLITGGWYSPYVISQLLGQPLAARWLLEFWFVDLLAPFAIAIGLAVWLVHRFGPDAPAGPGRPRQARWRQARWRIGEDASYLAVCVLGLLLAALAGRLHDGGYANVAMPAHVGAAIGFGLVVAMVLRHSACGRRTVVVLAGALAVQFIVMTFWRLDVIPTDADRAGGDAFIASVRNLPGEVLIPTHPYYLRLAGLPTHSSAIAIGDVLHSRGGRGRDAMAAALPWDLAGVSAIVLDNEGDTALFGDTLARDFTMVSTSFVAAGVFVPVTDAPTRPALLYVRTSLLAAP